MQWQGMCLWVWLALLLAAQGHAAIRPRDTVAMVTLYRTRDGLPQSEVTSMYRDAQAVMWFGTRGGMARYDGEQFVAFQHDPLDSTSLASDEIRQIRGDAQGNLWIATSAGISRYSPANLTFRNYRIWSGPSVEDRARGVWAVNVDHAGRIWVMTSLALGLLDTVTGRVHQYPYPPHRAYSPAYPRHMLEHDGHDCLWLVRGGELLLFRTSDLTYVPDPEQAMMLSNVSPSGITGLALQQDGSIWIGQGAEIYHYTQPGNAPLQYQLPVASQSESGRVGALTLDYRDRVWIRMGNAFLRLDPEDGQWMRVSSLWENGLRIGPTHHEAYDFSDGQNYWLSADGGAARWHQTSGFITTYSHRSYGEPLFPNLDIRSVHTRDDRSLWVGTCGGGVSRFDRITGRVDHTPRRTHDGRVTLDTVYGLLRATQGRLVAIAPGGVALYDSVAGIWRTVLDSGGGQFRCGALLDSTHLLVGSTTGLCLVNLSSGAVRREHPLGERRITAVQPTPTGVYLAADGELLRYDVADQHLVTHSAQEIDPALGSTTSLRVRTLAWADEGVLYVGTNHGIYRYELGNFRRVGQRTQEIPQNVQSTQSMLVDSKGVVWSASSRWIGEYTWSDEDFYTYGVADAVDVGEYNELSAYCSPRGKLYFGGKNGMVMLDPDHDSRASRMPMVILSRCVVENDTGRMALPLRLRDTIDVPRGFNAITLSFALLDYSAPGSARYQYMLEGFVEDWRDVVGGHTFTVANLPAGVSRLRYRASNREGIWQEGREYTLVVHRTWSDLALLGGRGIALLALGGGIFWQVRQRRRHARAAAYGHQELWGTSRS